MPEFLVNRVETLRDGSVVILTIAGREIGVFREGNEFYAYENVCLHQGGPVCEGMRTPRVEDVIGPDKILQGQRFVEGDIHIVCPWHGYEYKLKTGECVGAPNKRLRKYEVVTRDGFLYVVV